MGIRKDDEDILCLFNATLTFQEGRDAAASNTDLYDLSLALRGFHRSLALTTHYFVHREIITQAPHIRDIRILSSPASQGSFEVDTSVMIVGAAIPAASALYALGTASRDTPLGHILWSLYDMVIHKCTGRHVDPDKTLYYQSLEETENETAKIESLAQKIDTAVVEMHRPIKTESAKRSILSIGNTNTIGFDSQTLDLAQKLEVETDASMFTGRVSGYSANTRSGMIYTEGEKRAIPFELERGIDIDSTVLTRSLLLYDTLQMKHRRGRSGFFKFNAKRAINPAGAVKRYYITQIYSESLESVPYELK